MSSRFLAVVVRVIPVAVIFAFLAPLTLPAEAAKPQVIRDECNQTSGDGMGHECPSETDLLIRPTRGSGCGDWICCPQNPDGRTYDCTKATTPTARTDVTDNVKESLGQCFAIATPQKFTQPASPPQAGLVTAVDLTPEQCSNRFSRCARDCGGMGTSIEQLRCMTGCYRDLCGCINSTDPEVLLDNPWCRCCPGGKPYP